MTRWCAVALVLSTPGPLTAGAPESSVEGVWDVSWAQAVRFNRDGSMEIQRWGEARLELDENSSRVEGTWTSHVLETVRWQVHGTFAEGRLTLSATEHDSTSPDLAAIEEMLWRAELVEGSLRGELALSFRSSERGLRWRPWTAQRREGG